MGGSWKVILAFVGVFIAGAIFGGLFTARSAGRRFAAQQAEQAALAATQPAPAPQTAPATRPANANRPPAQNVTPVMLRRLTTQLKLTDEQREKIRPIVARADEDMQFLRRENFRSTTRVLDRMHADIAVLLTDQQRADLEVLKHKMQESLKRAENEKRDEVRMRKDQTGVGRGNPDTAATAAAPAPKGN
jgi:hypothetical protein